MNSSGGDKAQGPDFASEETEILEGNMAAKIVQQVSCKPVLNRALLVSSPDVSPDVIHQ